MHLPEHYFYRMRVHYASVIAATFQEPQTLFDRFEAQRNRALNRCENWALIGYLRS